MRYSQTSPASGNRFRESHSVFRRAILAGITTIATALALIATPVLADSRWNGLDIFSNNWTSALNWAGLDVPDNSLEENVEIGAGGPSTLNQDWRLNGLLISNVSIGSTAADLFVSNGSELTLLEGIRNTNVGCPGAADPTFCHARVHFPIRLQTGASGGGPVVNTVGFETTSGSVPINFFGTVFTDGNNLQLRSNGGDINIRSRITGSGQVRKDGSGDAVIFSSTNDYTGPTTVNAGRLITRDSGRLPDASDLRVFGNGLFLLGIPSTADAINGLFGDGRVGINTNNTLVIGNYAGFNSVGEGSFDGELFGGGNLTKRGIDGTQSLNGLINIAGNIFVEEGELEIGSGAIVNLTPDITVGTDGTFRSAAIATYGDIDVDGVVELSGGEATFDFFRLGVAQSAFAEIHQTAGSHSVSELLEVGVVNGGIAEYNMFGGSLFAGALDIGGGGLVTQTGGDVNSPGVGVGHSGTSGEYTLEGGTLFTSTIGIGLSGGQGVFDLQGGTHSATFVQVGSATPGADGEYALNGGTLDAGQITVFAADGIFNFFGGTLAVDNFIGDLTNQGGTLSPGNSPGLTTITGDYTQGAAGTLLIEFAGLTPEAEYDVVNVSGTAFLDGILDVDLLGGFTPSNGDSFDILLAVAISGEFSTTLFPALSPGLRWELQYLFDEMGSTDIVRLTAAVPIPPAVWLFASGLGLVGWLGRRRVVR